MLKLGIIGTGRIAQRFIESAWQDMFTVVSVYNPNLPSARSFVNKNATVITQGNGSSIDVNRVVATSLEECAEQVDAVYIATPHDTHYQYAKAMLLRGKHVLCEKPIALRKEEAAELYALAAEKDLVLMEALKTAYCPGFQQVLQAVESGIIGEVREVEACFTRITMNHLRELTDIQYGGSVTELGSYVLFPVMRILGTDYNNIEFHVHRKRNGIDDFTWITLDYENAFASCKIGLGAKSEGQMIITGSRGYLVVQAPWWMTKHFEIRYEDPRRVDSYDLPYEGSGLQYECEAFALAILKKTMPEAVKDVEFNGRMLPEESIAISEVMEQFLEKEVPIRQSRSEDCEGGEAVKELQYWAHRGLSTDYPENSLSAFIAAAKTPGVKGIELDVQLTKDGEVVVFHDENVKRVTNGDQRVLDYTLEELQQLWIAPQDEKKERIPTLSEVLACMEPYCKNNGFLINIELKTGIIRYEGIEEKVYAIVQKYGLEQYIVYSSFLADSIKRMKEINPKNQTGMLASFLSDCVRLGREAGADALHPHIGGMDMEIPADYQGKPVRAWNGEEPFFKDGRPLHKLLNFAQFAGMGVTEIFSNRPNLYLDTSCAFYPLTEEFENGEYKNGLISRTTAGSMVFVYGEKVSESLQQRIYEQLRLYPGIPMLLCEGEEGYKNSKDLYDLKPESVIGIVCPKALFAQVGAFQEKLYYGNTYEMFSRMCDEIGGFVVVKTEENTSGLFYVEAAGELAYTLAYLVRNQMNHWHRQGTMDENFAKLCAQMKEYGVFNEFQQYLNGFLTDEREYRMLAGNTAPFLIIKGDDTCGGVLRQFASDLTKALVAQGQAVKVMNGNSTDLEAISQGIYKGIVGFQSPALEIDYFKNLKGPKFQFWFDYPLHFEGILRNLPKDYTVLCQDEKYAELIRNFFNTQAIQFSPGGIAQEEIQQERPYDVVFMGTYFADDCETLEQEQKDYYHYMIEHPLATFEVGLQNMLGLTEEEIDQDTFVSKLIYLKPACRAVIGHFRNKVVETFIDAGIEVHVYGREWEASPFRNQSKMVIHDRVSVEESLSELRKAKIGLNVMSWHKGGMTEKVANILLSGAVCLSDETTYLCREMADGENIVLFSLDHLEDMVKKVQHLLENPAERANIAHAGYRKAAEEFTWEVQAGRLIRLANSALEGEKSIRIYVATHVAFNPPNNEIYVPIHVGREGKKDLGYLGDNTGSNISDLNHLYGELTGLFWIWQNVNDVDYIGMCHYRRYFINDESREMQESEYLELLSEYDAIVPKHAECEPNYYEHYGRAHNAKDLDAVEKALKKLYPEYADAYDRIMAGTIFYYGNLVVTSAYILKAYAEWLFHIFLEAGEEIDVSTYDSYHARVFGFLSEQMFYVFAEANGLHLKEVRVGISGEKAETLELKKELKELMKQGKENEARELLLKRLAVRPDLLLEGSDINRELSDICKELKVK